MFRAHVGLKWSNRCFLQRRRCDETARESALTVPAPDGGIVTHGDQNAAVAAEARLTDG